MGHLLLTLLVLLVTAGLVVVVRSARDQRLRPSVVRGLAAACGAALLVMLVSDWPAELLSTFWADHSVLAALLGSVLLVGLVFEDGEVRAQQALDRPPVVGHGFDRSWTTRLHEVGDAMTRALA